MSYQTDYSPVDYLKRRVIYYKKQRGRFRNFINKPDKISTHLISKYGMPYVLDQYEKRFAQVEGMIKEYEQAITRLES